MSAFDTVKRALEKSLGYVEPVLHAMQLIQTITQIGGSDAATALRIIDAIVKTVSDGIHLGLDPKDITAELNKLAAGIAANDAKADADLDARFPTGSGL